MVTHSSSSVISYKACLLQDAENEITLKRVILCWTGYVQQKKICADCLKIVFFSFIDVGKAELFFSFVCNPFEKISLHLLYKKVGWIYKAKSNILFVLAGRKLSNVPWLQATVRGLFQSKPSQQLKSLCIQAFLSKTIHVQLLFQPALTGY